MLIGEYKHSIDTKGRVIIPKALRPDMDERFVITSGIDKNSVYVFPKEEQFDNYINKIEEQLNSAKAKNRKILRKIYADSRNCELDSQGRILIPPHLREMANLGKDVVVVGARTRIEIWGSDSYDSTDDVDLATEFEDLGIEF